MKVRLAVRTGLTGQKIEICKLTPTNAKLWIPSLNSHSTTFQPATRYSPLSTSAPVLPTIHFVKEFTMFCIFDKRIEEVLPAPAQRAVGGRGGSRIRVFGISSFFVGRRSG